jgi:hypothetical protein
MEARMVSEVEPSGEPHATPSTLLTMRTMGGTSFGD